MAVAIVFGGCLLRRADVKRGMELKYPLRSARNRVDRTGLPKEACINLMYLASDGRDSTALACPVGFVIGSVQERSAVSLGV